VNINDHRSFPRVAVTRPVWIRTSSGAVVQARSTNISQGGLAVAFESPAEIGAVLELSFSLVVRGRQVDFRLQGTACFNHLSGNGYIIGFKFTKIDADASENLREFVAYKRSMKDA
jgi:c-di-GMP-binding flagellar brake protein YcgR